jgi:DNA-binding IclR family transcriptional regulator
MNKVITSTSGGRILRVLKALKGASLTGRSNSELAKALDESPANINRALNTLIEEGIGPEAGQRSFRSERSASANCPCSQQ